MNRLIKFRIWVEDQKRFRYCDYIPTMGFVWALAADKDNPNNCSALEIGEEYAQQFTGIKDKNSREIYEGDIIKYNFGSEFPEEYFSEVYFDEKYACFCFDRVQEYDFIREGLICEVVGNIYHGAT